MWYLFVRKSLYGAEEQWLGALEADTEAAALARFKSVFGEAFDPGLHRQAGALPGERLPLLVARETSLNEARRAQAVGNAQRALDDLIRTTRSRRAPREAWFALHCRMEHHREVLARVQITFEPRHPQDEAQCRAALKEVRDKSQDAKTWLALE